MEAEGGGEEKEGTTGAGVIPAGTTGAGAVIPEGRIGAGAAIPVGARAARGLLGAARRPR